MSQATRVRLLWPAVLLAALFFSSWSPGRPEELAGTPSSLSGLEVATDLPASLGLWAGWHRKGDRFVVDGEFRKAIFCYHQAEDTFPRVRPNFPEGSDWNEREWSGRPIRTYLAKALVYALLGEDEASDYYLALCQSHRESPSDDQEVARVRSVRAYNLRNFDEVRTLLASSNQPTDQLLVAISAYKAGDNSYLPRVQELYRAVLANPIQVNRLAWLPADAKRTVEGLR